MVNHGKSPDIFVQHIAEMNLIGFLCNFGGLLGMWLGLSLFGIFNDIFEIITRITYRNYIIKFKNKYNNLNIKKVKFRFNVFLPNRVRP